MRVWVAGLGLIGQSVAQASRALGAHVTVTDVDPRRLQIAAQLGAHRVIDITDDAAIESLTQGGPYDRIVDACGAPDLFDFIYEHKLLALYGAIGAARPVANRPFFTRLCFTPCGRQSSHRPTLRWKIWEFLATSANWTQFALSR